MRISTILGPVPVDVKNQLSQIVEVATADSIIAKTGPKHVFVCDDNTDALDLALGAFRSLQSDVGRDALSFKNLIYVTENNRLRYPGNGYLFANLLEFDEKISVLDINSGCTGFVDALRIASHFSDKTLIVCAENYSKNMASFNRTVSPIFSDAAAVVFFDPADWAVLEFDSRVDASGWEAISCQHGGELQMDGRRVFEFVNAVATPLIRDIIARHQVDHIFLHQGSVLVLEHIIKKLRNTHPNIPVNVSDRGNLVSATIPKLIQDTLGASVDIAPGTKMLLASFGVGLATSLLLLERQ